MKKLKLEVELEYDDTIMHSNDKESIDWFYTEILMKENLIVHSNEIGDCIGEMKVLEIIN